jgi:ABC-type molybdenum transport system, ATPase component/photorepair protein PhrA
VLTAAWGQISRYTEEYEGQDLERGHDLLAALGIGDLGERPLHSLSEGEVRRVLLARSLMANPEIIVLDEPTAGLDLGGRETLLGALHEIMTGRKAPTVVMVTHEPEQIGSSFSHALLLKNGHIAHSGLIDDVITGEKLSEVFEVPLRVSHEDGRFLVRTSEN